MLNTFKIAYRLRAAYRVNSFIYSLRTIPLIGRLIPYNFYGDKALKIIGILITVLLELFTTFVFKLVYVFAAIYVPAVSFGYNSEAQSFLHILIFMTLAGGIANRPLFEMSKDKYYGISLMRMDAREYLLSFFCYYCLRAFIGMAASLLLFTFMLGLNPLYALGGAAFVVFCKSLVAGLELMYKCRKIGQSPKTDMSLLVLGILPMAAAYGLPFLGVCIGEAVFIVLLLLAGLGCIPAIGFLTRSKAYRPIFKSLNAAAQLVLNPKGAAALAQEKRMKQQLDVSAGRQLTGLKGYRYFHRLFMDRHRKMMSRMAKRIALVIGAAVAIIAVVITIVPDIGESINRMTLTYLPYFVIVMYAINRGQSVSQAMFMNCDHSMLSYRFYRRPGDILGLFSLRLRSVVAINLWPALVLGLGLPILLFISGGTDNPLNYLVLFATIVSLSVFFSVHHLVIYYLLQPYNAQVEIKSKSYNLVSGLTYLVSYMFINVKLPTVQFGSWAIIFTVLYLIISLMLAYRLAPKTFKIRG